MASLVQTLLIPQRLGVTLIDAIPRIVVALEKIERRLDKIDELPRHIEGLQSAFDRSNDEIEALRRAMKPELADMANDLDDVKDAIAPIGRLADRIPGGKKR